MNIPHGGKLINRQVDKKDLDLKNVELSIELSEDQYSEIWNMATGVYSPLEGYMNKDDFMSVLEKMTLANGLAWSIPVFLPLTKEDWSKLKIGSQIELNYNSNPVAVLNVEDLYDFDKDDYCLKVYGTNDKEHPGVAMIQAGTNHVAGGEIWFFGELERKYQGYDLTPSETRAIFEKNGWQTIVGFQTRNAAHRAHEYIQKLCLEFVDGLFINPIIGKKKSGDFKDEVILEVYKGLTEQFYPKNSTQLSIYKAKMNYAGPKEAIFHSIVRKNFGCTHFIVGRDHAGVGDYYDKLAAHRIFDQVENLGVQIMKVSNSFYDRRAQMFTTDKTSPFSEIYRIAPSGTQVRKYIMERNYNELQYIMRDEVLDIILKFDKPFVE